MPNSRKIKEALAAKHRIYAELRDSGENSYNAAVGAGVSPHYDSMRFERWYQAERTGKLPAAPADPQARSES